MSRYERQIAFAPFGREGQARLRRARVLIVGCGALGGTVAGLLVRAGVGAVTLIDPDIVRTSNLHRQTLFVEQDAKEGRYKVEAAEAVLRAANGDVRLETIVGRFDGSNDFLAESFDLSIDATDDFSTRFLLNRAAVRYRKPLISAGIREASGQILTVLPGETACLECFLDPADAPGAEFYGILPPTPSLFASLEAIEAIKILAGHPETVNRSLLSVDLWNNSFRRLNIPRDEHCPVCGIR